jgi:predicted ATP-binding protein involved in virulence
MIMKEPVYFLKLQIENFLCFGEKAILDLSDNNGNWKKWTVILGNNGTGKTTLLKSIALFELEKRPSPLNKIIGSLNSPSQYWMKNIYPFNETYLLTSELEKGNKYFYGTLSRHINLSDGTFSNILSIIYKSHGEIRTSADSNDADLKIFGYGANRYMDSVGSSPIGAVAANSETLFNDDAKLINAEEWLLQLDYAASKESSVKEFAAKKRNQVKEILLDLLPDIEEIRFTTPTKDNLKSTVEFKTDYGYWVNIHQLSLGYKTMVAWTVDLAARMFDRYPDSDNPLTEPAIVLVDEIDLHLHPKWQRKIFDHLSERFPKTQFIVTAHSPLIVQSAPQDANIVLLRKEDGHVVIDNDIKSVENWRLDQIMSSDLFGIESARGPETEKWLDERKNLLQKKELSSAEFKRLKDLNEKANQLPTADSKEDIEAMELIRDAANYLKSQKA